MDFRLFCKLVNHSVQELIINRKTAALTFLLGTMFFALEIIAGLVFFEHTDSLLGWSKTDYLLLVSTANSISFIYQTFFVASHENLTNCILDGQLDYVFLRPVDSFWYYALYRIDIPSFFNLLVCLFVQIYMLRFYSINFIQYILFGFSMLICAYFLFALNQLVVMVAFWTDNATSLLGFPEYLVEFSTRPLVVYPNSIRFIFTWFVPLLIGMNIPLLIVRNENYQINLIFLIIFNILLTILLRYIWKNGLKQYASAN